jgi:hypothetical protein
MLYYSDGSYSPNNQRGPVEVEPDWNKILGGVKDKINPSALTAGGAASKLLKFITDASPELKAISVLKGFAGDNPTTSYQALICRIDFTFPLPPKVTLVGTQSG